MAAMGGARRALLSARSSAPSIFKSFTSPPSSSSPHLRRCKLPARITRLPVELGSIQSLLPLHSATASALLTSMLASKMGSWAWLSEEAGYMVLSGTVIDAFRLCRLVGDLGATHDTPAEELMMVIPRIKFEST